MKLKYRFFLSLLMLALCFSACKNDHEPEPKFHHYLEFIGKVYELKSANYSYPPNNEKELFLEFSTLTKEEMQEKGGVLKGSWVNLAIVTSVDRKILPGTYVLDKGRSENANLPAINFFIEMDGENQSGILISPVSGELTISDIANEKLIIFNFLASNGEKITGRFQGDIVNLLE